MFEMEFLKPIFQSLLASVIYDVGKTSANAFCNCSTITKRYKKAFEKAVCRFYADPKYAGNEARLHYDDYVNMLYDASKQDDILKSSSHLYKQMFDLFVQEVSNDLLLQGYTMLRGVFTTQKQLEETNKKIKETINLAMFHRKESKQEHEKISEQIKELEALVANPKMQSITIASLNGSAVMQKEQESHIIFRRQLIQACIMALDAGKLVILYGALKVGKTTLAQLVAKEKEGVIIIANVVKQDLEVKVSKLLATKTEEKIIITTTSALNESFSTLDFSLIEQIEIPLLSIAETVELINTYKPTFDLSVFIYGHTSGHPVLVKTLCSYFASCGWTLDEGNFDQILNYSFDRDLTRAMSDLVSRIITDTETRILLNRLLLINGFFTEKEAQQLAEVNPQIVEVKRKLYSLMPTWISDNDGQFKISPLLNKLWPADISSECLKECYIILARNILNLNKPLNEHDILNYINYSLRSDEYDNAGYMYITVLIKLYDAKCTLPEKSLLKSVWIDLPLPVGMSIKVKIGVRMSQLLLLSNLSKKHRNYVLWDLKQLVESYEDEDLKAFFYITITLICWQENDVVAGLKYYNICNTLDKKGTEAIMAQCGEEISLWEKNIWIFLLRLTTVDEYEIWLDTFRTTHINYSPGDRDVCNFCYLSISRLIDHIKGNDIEIKIGILERIKNKAEQCKCPEIAIVSLFKSLDLLAFAGKCAEAQRIYDTQYEKYKDHPLAVLLFNAAMAFACYKVKLSDKDSLHYFRQVIEFSDKELISDIQLHIKEIFAYVVAEKDPEQSVVLLNEALEYASDENHRVDIIEYYQCKGELSYAYWCIGERVKSVDLLSECVDFVLPLAEAEKEFAKTYLCLCHCLIIKYCMDIQEKSLPANQASPVRGMFTENNLMFLDDLYSVDRLYMACYQMSDLCERLPNNDLAYKWAKKSVNICRKGGEIKESHYLLFLLAPLLKADVDLDDIAFIIKHTDKARRIAYQLHSKIKIENKDHEFVEFQIIPLLLEALVLKIRGNDMGIELVKDVVKNYIAVTNGETIGYIKSIFERDTYDRAFIAEINKLNVQEQYSVYLCAYIMTAFYSDSDYAFDLLIAIMPELQKQLVQIYGTRIITIINLFISTFWKTKVFRNPEEFVDYGHLKKRGLKIINEHEGRLNQANKTMMVIRYHLRLDHKMNGIQENWLDS